MSALCTGSGRPVSARVGRRRLLGIAAAVGVLCALVFPAWAGSEPSGHGHAAGDAHGEHAAQGEQDAHGGHDAHHEINWAHGFVGEKEGVEPGLLWRAPGTPMPLLANFINSGILIFLLVWLGRGPVLEGLRARKERIVAGMEEARRLHEEAEAQLADYQHKLAHIEEEIARVRREMREATEAERERILGEAKARRERMVRDAQLLVEQEMKAMHDTLLRETVEGAMRSARELLTKEVSSSDQQRLAQELVEGLEKGVVGVRAAGGAA